MEAPSIQVTIRSPTSRFLQNRTDPAPIYISPRANAPRTNFFLNISPNSSLNTLKRLTESLVIPLFIMNCISPFAFPEAFLTTHIINTLVLCILGIKTCLIRNSTRSYQVFLNQGGRQTQPIDVEVRTEIGETV